MINLSKTYFYPIFSLFSKTVVAKFATIQTVVCEYLFVAERIVKRGRNYEFETVIHQTKIRQNMHVAVQRLVFFSSETNQ